MATPKRGKSHAVSSMDQSPRNFRWSQPYEDTLLELLVRETRMGNRPDSAFTSTAFRNVINDFKLIHGTEIMKKHIQSRIKTMKSHYAMFHAAFNGLSGFAWNIETKKFEAEESLWAQRIQEDPGFGRFRDKSCYNWEKLCELFGDTRARGDCAGGLKSQANKLKRGLQFEDLNVNSVAPEAAVFANDTSSYGDHDAPMGETTPTSLRALGSSQQSGGTSRSKQKRKSELVTVMEEGYKTMAASIDRLSMALAANGDKVAGTKFDVSHNTQVYEALSSLGLEEAYKVKCFVHLSGNPSKGALVVASPPEIRAQILHSIMNPGGAEQ